ncbi:CPBP family intramembrane glutamic endopeptidase [Paenibacillus sp. 2003]|uniref:CPBP family intramembrane glutamic endopeptidase n=1 Tax=Paenibacillus TaxID=44249 RepID=UPI0028667A22|nr:CPBP family intramembrane glutamic endopeptidase [Paenibacillus sp. 2003]MDR6719296.1 membrane protease YdiL (CAAX protease family) [Paenibacillus sp. 2003]
MYSGKDYNLKEVAIKIGLILSVPAVISIIILTILKALGNTNVDDSFVFIIFQVIAYATFLSLSKRFRCFTSGMLNLKVDIKQTVIYVFTGLVLFSISSLLLLGFGIGSDESQRENLNLDQLSQALNFQNIIMTVAIIVVIPFYEELLFRGLLFTTIYNKYGFAWSIIISSLIFGFLHSDLFVLTTIYGFVFNYIFLKTKSLIPGIMLHMIWNALVVLL